MEIPEHCSSQSPKATYFTGLKYVYVYQSNFDRAINIPSSHVVGNLLIDMSCFCILIVARGMKTTRAK